MADNDILFDEEENDFYSSTNSNDLTATMLSIEMATLDNASYSVQTESASVTTTPTIFVAQKREECEARNNQETRKNRTYLYSAPICEGGKWKYDTCLRRITTTIH